jgi:hypothetical protein
VRASRRVLTPARIRSSITSVSDRARRSARTWPARRRARRRRSAQRGRLIGTRRPPSVTSARSWP